jgi:hypothetical protein
MRPYQALPPPPPPPLLLLLLRLHLLAAFYWQA